MSKCLPLYQLIYHGHCCGRKRSKLATQKTLPVIYPDILLNILSQEYIKCRTVHANIKMKCIKKQIHFLI